MTDRRARIPALWWDDRERDPDLLPSAERTGLIVQYDDETLYIDGLRDGVYLSIAVKDLFAAMAATAGGKAEVVDAESAAAS
jgi:hypothetical protein